MTKAILELDMPKSCGACQLASEDGYCTATDKKISNILWEGRPTWCPLQIKEEPTFKISDMYGSYD